jgi:Skp family chaperone for outer membrane proteins
MISEFRTLLEFFRNEYFRGFFRGTQDRSVLSVREDSSTGSTTKIPERRRFKRTLFSTGAACLVIGFFVCCCGKCLADSNATADGGDAENSNATAVGGVPANAIAIVDMKKIASDSEAGKSIGEQIAKINDASKKDLSELEEKIKSMESDKTRNLDQRKIEDMQLILYDMVSAKKDKIAEAYRVAILTLEEEITKAVACVAKEKGLKVVLTSEAVIFSSESCLNITADVTEKLNENCKEIKVVLSK